MEYVKMENVNVLMDLSEMIAIRKNVLIIVIITESVLMGVVNANLDPQENIAN